jgi:phospholipase/lecithinase/hemolysin
VRGTTGEVKIGGSGSGLATPATSLLRVFNTASVVGISVSDSRGLVDVTGAKLNSSDYVVEKHTGPVSTHTLPYCFELAPMFLDTNRLNHVAPVP